MKRGRVPSQPRRSGRGSGPGQEQAAAMMRLAGPGGRDAGRPVRRVSSPYPSLPFPAWALVTTAPRYSRFVHQLPHLPHVQHRAPRGPGRLLPLLLRTDSRSLPRRGRSRPGRCRPPPRTSQVSSFSSHSLGAAGDTSRREGRGAAWSGSAGCSSRCARGTPGLVVLRATRSSLN